MGETESPSSSSSTGGATLRTSNRRFQYESSLDRKISPLSPKVPQVSREIVHASDHHHHYYYYQQQQSAQPYGQSIGIRHTPGLQSIHSHHHQQQQQRSSMAPRSRSSGSNNKVDENVVVVSLSLGSPKSFTSDEDDNGNKNAAVEDDDSGVLHHDKSFEAVKRWRRRMASADETKNNKKFHERNHSESRMSPYSVSPRTTPTRQYHRPHAIWEQHQPQPQQSSRDESSPAHHVSSRTITSGGGTATNGNKPQGRLPVWYSPRPRITPRSSTSQVLESSLPQSSPSSSSPSTMIIDTVQRQQQQKHKQQSPHSNSTSALVPGKPGVNPSSQQTTVTTNGSTLKVNNDNNTNKMTSTVTPTMASPPTTTTTATTTKDYKKTNTTTTAPPSTSQQDTVIVVGGFPFRHSSALLVCASIRLASYLQPYSDDHEYDSIEGTASNDEWVVRRANTCVQSRRRRQQQQQHPWQGRQMANLEDDNDDCNDLKNRDKAACRGYDDGDDNYDDTDMMEMELDDTPIRYWLEIPHKSPREWEELVPFLQPRSVQAAAITPSNLPVLLPWFDQLELTVLLQECDTMLASLEWPLPVPDPSLPSDGDGSNTGGCTSTPVSTPSSHTDVHATGRSNTTPAIRNGTTEQFSEACRDVTWTDPSLVVTCGPTFPVRLDRMGAIPSSFSSSRRFHGAVVQAIDVQDIIVLLQCTSLAHLPRTRQRCLRIIKSYWELQPHLFILPMCPANASTTTNNNSNRTKNKSSPREKGGEMNDNASPYSSSLPGLSLLQSFVSLLEEPDVRQCLWRSVVVFLPTDLKVFSHIEELVTNPLFPYLLREGVLKATSPTTPNHDRTFTTRNRRAASPATATTTTTTTTMTIASETNPEWHSSVRGEDDALPIPPRVTRTNQRSDVHSDADRIHQILPWRDVMGDGGDVAEGDPDEDWQSSFHRWWLSWNNPQAVHIIHDELYGDADPILEGPTILAGGTDDPLSSCAPSLATSPPGQSGWDHHNSIQYTATTAASSCSALPRTDRSEWLESILSKLQEPPPIALDGSQQLACETPRTFAC